MKANLHSFEALNLYCLEYDVMFQSEFRDGNVNPGYGQLGQLKKALSLLPEGITKVKLRSDSAGYQKELLKFCAEGKDERFGVIDFAISCSGGIYRFLAIREPFKGKLVEEKIEDGQLFIEEVLEDILNIVGNLVRHDRQLALKLFKSKASDWFLYDFDHLKSFNLLSDFSTS